MLVVVAEKRGVVALVRAAPEGYEEVTRRTLLEGKTWNHPVLIDGRLYVRNGTQAACLDIAVP